MTRCSKIAVMVSLFLVLVSCGTETVSGQVTEPTPELADLPTLPDQIPDDFAPLGTNAVEAPQLDEGGPEVLDLGSARLGGGPAVVVLGTDGRPFSGTIEGQAAVEREGNRIVLRADDATVGLVLPDSLGGQDLGEVVDLRMSWFDSPLETEGADHLVEVSTGGAPVFAALWRFQDEPVIESVLGLEVEQLEVAASPDGSDFAETDVLVNGRAAVIGETVEVDDMLVFVEIAALFQPEDAEVFGSGYILKLWVAPNR